MDKGLGDKYKGKGLDEIDIHPEQEEVFSEDSESENIVDPIPVTTRLESTEDTTLGNA